MMEKVKEYARWLWDWVKRIFGRSKIVFLQVVGIIATGWLEIADPLSMLNWDTIVDKHEAAIALQIGIQVVTALMRVFASSGPANFRALPPVPELPRAVEEDRPSPKAD